MKDNQNNISNKKSRVLVNVIGIPLLLFTIIAGNDFYEIPLFFLFVFIVMILSAYEWNNLMKIDNRFAESVE